MCVAAENIVNQERTKWSQRNARLMSLLAVLILVTGSNLEAQTSACADTTSFRSQFYRDSYAGIASRTDPASVASRAASGVPTVAATSVRLVADTTVCRTASNAFDGHVQQARPTTPVIVLEIGDRRIVIKDTGLSGRWINMLFSQDFATFLKSLTL